ncbi:golvesin C-terminal-like domain-containing protein, partial [Sanguibacteroides justesenii]|uniref:golvesin C-terminal-like domain-containing protein n=1 Tax=Sanguibacteroides justesenii TaxID=1547597 RepID=UPI0015E8BCF5
SGYVQPEMYFFPEQMIGIPLPNFKEEVTRMRENALAAGRMVYTQFEYEMRVLEITIRQVLFYTKIRKIQFDNLLRKLDKKEIFVNNPYTDFPLYNDYTISFCSREYPVLDVLLNQMIYMADVEEYMRVVSSKTRSGVINNVGVRHYLSKNSFSDALSDMSFSPTWLNDLFRIKIDQLKDILLLYSSSEKLNKFLIDFVRQHTFEQVDFETLNVAYKQEFGIDLSEFLPQWYLENKVPAYIIRDFKMEKIIEPEVIKNLDVKKRYKVQASIYNVGEVDGIISFGFATDRGSQRRNFLIKKKEGKRIEWIGDGIDYSVSLFTNIARNIPETRGITPQEGFTTTDTVQRIEQLPFSYFQPPANEIIVNEDDEGFRVIQPKSRLLLGRLLGQREEGYITIDGSSSYAGEFPVWTYLAAPSYAYGDITEGFVSKKAGRGDFSVEWHAPIEKTGMYEIFVYMTPIPCYTCGRYMYNWRNLIPTNTIQLFQYYQVTCDEGVKEIPLDVNIDWKAEKGGWVSLGRFKLTLGEHVVTLSDKSNASDFNIYADAVKWVYLEDK